MACWSDSPAIKRTNIIIIVVDDDNNKGNPSSTIRWALDDLGVLKFQSVPIPESSLR